MAPEQDAAELSKVPYHHLGPRVSQLLYCLAVLEHRHELATREKLAAMLRTTLDNVSYLINRLKTARPEYLTSHPLASTESFAQATARNQVPGRPPATYHISVERVITLAQTARIILDALELSREPDVLTKQKFISKMVSRYGLAESFIEERLVFCFSNDYLSMTPDNLAIYPSPSGRIMAELTYLTLLAADYRPARTRTARKKGGGA